MWTEVPTKSAFFDCRPPFSFYFDLVRPRWKGDPACNVALHRICTLARKMGVQSLYICDALARHDVREDVEDVDVGVGGGGSAEAFDIHFFSEEIGDEARLQRADSEAFLGRATVINYMPPGRPFLTYVLESLFRIPRLRRTPDERDDELLNNYVHTRRCFDVNVLGKTFPLTGVYYCQQNSFTSVCAHACLKMALNSIDQPNRVTTRNINQKLGLSAPVGGLSLDQINQILDDFGLQPFVFSAEPGAQPDWYIPALYSVVESGFPALLVFTTAKQGESHIVPVFGHTLNSDEWHPQAHRTPAYLGPQSAPFLSSSAWADHFLVHDDNFGPYYCVSDSAFTGQTASAAAAAQPQWPPLFPQSVIGLFPAAIQSAPLEVDGATTSWLNAAVPALKNNGRGDWWGYMNEAQWPRVLRTFLIERDVYVAHLRASRGHDGSQLQQGEIDWLLQGLPGRFWISEFSTPSLYTGNKSKLGEVLVDSSQRIDPATLFASVLAMRAPSLMTRNALGGNADWHRTSLGSHSPLFRRVDAGYEW